jgi:phosphatidyl-myo-inositol dimannoside synthase
MLKRLLIISPEFNQDYTIYQPWKQILEISKKLQSRGIEIAIGTNATNDLQVQGINIISFSDIKLRQLNNDSIDKILKFKPDIILWIGNPLSGVYLKKLKINSIPIVLYISTVPFSTNEIKNFSLSELPQLGLANFLTSFFPFNKIFKNLNHENIAGIIVPNNTIKKSLIDKGTLENKISVAPLCFETENDLKYFKLEQNSHDIFTLCYLGPVYSIRGVDFLLDVIELFKKNKIRLKLKFLLRTTDTDKDYELLVAKCKKRNIQEFLEIRSGILDRSSLFTEISNSDIVVIPTKFVWNEPPLAILEAMHLGKLVITSNVCGLQELVANHGCALDLKPKLFFDIIQNFINDDNSLEKIALKGQDFVNSLPDWDFFADWLLTNLTDFQLKNKK